MDAQASRLAAVLVQHGVGKDDVLGVQLPNIGELVMTVPGGGADWRDCFALPGAIS